MEVLNTAAKINQKRIYKDIYFTVTCRESRTPNERNRTNNNKKRKIGYLQNYATCLLFPSFELNCHQTQIILKWLVYSGCVLWHSRTEGLY